MFSKMTTFLETLPNTKCHFQEEIISYLTTMHETTVNYFAKVDGRFHDMWIVRPFAVKESAISNEDLGAKVAFLQIWEDPQLKVDF